MAGRSDVVLLEAGNGQGTGFLVAPGRLVTALHVVAMFERDRAVVDDAGLPKPLGRITCTYYSMDRGPWHEYTTFDPREHPYSVFGDWAILEVKQSDGVRVWKTAIASRADRGGSCRTFGFPISRGSDGAPFVGEISGVHDPFSSWTTTSVSPCLVLIHRAVFKQAVGWAGQTPSGFSGGPVVINAEGEDEDKARVVGIMRRYEAIGDSGVAEGATVEITPIEAIYFEAGISAVPPEPPDVSSPKYVFVVHASPDKLLATRLCRSLLQHGVRPWLDIWDLGPEPGWQNRLDDALVSAPAVLVCDGPGGLVEQASEHAAALGIRIVREPRSVLRVGLPGAPTPAQGVERFDLSGNWDERVGALAVLLGTDRDRYKWLELEAEVLSIEPAKLSPYRGLEAFRECDARWMFGRDEEIANLLERVATQSLVTVIGASGSGKSSLVRGGLCPALRHGALGARFELIGILRPGSNPCDALARALVELSGGGDDRARDLRIGDLRNRLRDSCDTLRLVAEELANEVSPGSTRQVVLVVDQLEELFTEARLGHDGTSVEAMPFVHNVIDATTGDDAPVRIVVTLRADFVASCSAVDALAEVLNRATYFTLPRMKALQIRDIVELPALRLGFQVEPDLLVTLVECSTAQPGQLPLLEHMMRELWQRRDHQRRMLRLDTYMEAGGIEGAIARAADNALATLCGKLHERAPNVMRRLMTRLVRVGETTQLDTRRRRTLDELGRDEETRLVLDALVSEARVLVSDEIEGVEVIEIAHEALLREWRVLVDWVNADRAALKLQDELVVAAKKYAETQQSEYLWSRVRLTETKAVLERSTVELNPAERRFVAASERVVRMQRRRNWAGTLMAFSLLIGIAVWWVRFDAERESEAQRTKEQEAKMRSTERALAKQTAAEKGARVSDLVREHGYNIEAAVLAVRAMGAVAPDLDRLPSAVYDGVLRLANTEMAFEYATVDAHAGIVSAVEFSPNGDRLATANDGPVTLWDAHTGEPISTLEGHSGRVYAVSFSSGGELLASASSDETARLWDASTGKTRFTLTGHSDLVVSLAFSPDGQHLATASRDNTAILWDTTTGRPIHTLGHAAAVNAVAFSTNGDRLATASDDGHARLWDTTTGRPVVLFGHADTVRDVAFSRSGTVLVTASNDRTAKLWDAQSGDLIRTLGHLDSVEDVAISPDGNLIATRAGNAVRIWEESTGSPLSSLEHSDRVLAMEFSPDGARIVTGSQDQTAKLWNVATGKVLSTLDSHSNWVRAVAFSPDGTRLATGSQDQTAKLWDASSGPIVKTLDVSQPVVAVAFTPDGMMFATAHSDGTAKLWNAASPESPTTLGRHGYSVNAMAFSPSGTRLATGSNDDTAALWDVSAGRPVALLDDHSGAVNDVAFSPNGEQLATASADKTVKLWDGDSGKLLLTLDKHTEFVGDVVYSPDGTRIVSASHDRTAKVWNARSGELRSTLAGHSDYVLAVGYSPDGTRIGTVSNDKTAKLWRANSGELLVTLEGHRDSVVALAFSSNEARLATASLDKTAKLWDAKTGELLFTLEAHSDCVTNVVFSLDGALLATTSMDKTARLWDAVSGELLATLDGHPDMVEVVAFSPVGDRVVVASLDRAHIWPMPALAVQISCQRLQLGRALRYPEVADDCESILAAR